MSLRTRKLFGGLVLVVFVILYALLAMALLARFLPGAPLVLETINPACWLAFFDTYIRDLTHQRPLHPDTLKYLVEASGFTGVDIQFRQAVGDSDRLGRVRIIGEAGSPLPRNVAQIADALNDHADKLNARANCHQCVKRATTTRIRRIAKELLRAVQHKHKARYDSENCVCVT